MPEVPRFLSQKQLPIEGAVQAPSSLATQDTSIARAIEGLGSGIQAEAVKRGQEAVRRSEAEERVKAELKARTQRNIDFLQANKANREIKVKTIEFEAFKETNDAIEWVSQAEKVDFTVDTTNMSPEKAEQAEQRAFFAQQDFLTKTTLEATVAIGEAATTQATVLYKDSLEDPSQTEEQRQIAKQQWLEIAKNTMEDNAAVELGDKIEEDAVEIRHDNLLQNTREQAAITPEAVLATVEEEQELRKRTGKEPEEDELSNQDLVSLKNYSKSVIESNKVKVEDNYNEVSGEAVSGWVEGINNGTLTESEVWATKIPVDATKEEDAAKLKTQFATVARGLTERRRDQQTKSKKEEREKLYDPRIVSDLKVRAENVKGRAEIDQLKLETSEALKNNIIEDADAESIYQKSEQSFDNLLSNTLSQSQSTFSRIMLKGTGSESLAPWLQVQSDALAAAGEPVDVQQLLATFSDVGKAKQWTVNTVKNEVELAMSKIENPTIDDQRKASLDAQKRWLRLSDIEIVGAYKAWLQTNP
jgi:hypothetical protein